MGPVQSGRSAAPLPLPQGAASREIRQVSRGVIACFLVSGAVGLVYEVLWIRLLGLVFGHTVFAVTTVLASFMAGLGLGSFLFGRVADRSTRLLRLYGALEIGIGIYCFLLPVFLGWTAQGYLWASHVVTLPYLAFSALQFTLVALLLLIPTCLMGATLPVLARFFVREDATLGRQVGILYAVNTLGAVLGALAAGYWLVPALGIRTTIQLAVVLNLGIGSLGLAFDRHLFCLSRGEGERPAAQGAAVAPAGAGREGPPACGSTWTGWMVAAGFGLSGAASMIYEVTWSRALSLIIGSSTYAFTAMLVAFLCGIAGGSWAFAALLAGRRIRAEAFGLLQIGIGISSLVLVPVLSRMPVWFLGLFQFSQDPRFVQGIQLAASLAVMLPPTLLIGATFPCAVQILARGARQVGSDTGWVYAINTIGAILGTILAGFAGIPLLGIQRTMRIGVGLNLAVGAAVLLSSGSARPRLLRAAAVGAAAAAAIGGCLLPAWDPALMSSGVAIYGRRYLPLVRLGEFDRPGWQPRVVFYRDGISGTVSVHRDGAAASLRINGKTDAGNTLDMHTQLFLGHIPMLLHPQPRRVLVIGLGSGVTAGAVAQYPVERIDIVEIEPAVVEASRFFDRENRHVLGDPRVRMIIADGRNFLLNARTRYDVIISEPSNPWVRGLATMFTREFYDLARSRLAPDGLMLQWVQGYNIAPEDLRMVVRTFRRSFPMNALWSTATEDNLLVGASRLPVLSLDRIQERYEASPALREDFARVGMLDSAGILADYLLGPEELARYAGEGPLNTDDTLWLEFSTPRSLYDTADANLNHRILRSYRSADLPPLPPTDRARLDTAQGRYILGQAFLGKGLPTEAEAEFALAGRLNPSHVDSRLAEARLLIERGKALKAVSMLEEVLARRPREPCGYALLGMAYQQQGLPERALAAARQAVALAPDSIEHHLLLGTLWREGGDLSRAGDEYESARRLRPADPDVLLALADVRIAQGALREAQALLQPLETGGGQQPIRVRSRAWHLSGLADLRAGRPEAATTALEAAARLAPLEVGVRLDLALAHEARGDLGSAADALDRALVLNPNHLVALQRLSALLDRLEAHSP